MLQSISVGLIIALVGYFFQQRSWRHRLHEEIRTRELTECMKLVESLGKAIDKRLTATSAFHGLIQREENDKIIKKEFQESIQEWMFEFSSFKSKIYYYFGHEKTLQFENEVHQSLRKVSEIIIRTEKHGRENLNSRDKLEHDSTLKMMSIARYKAFHFLRELNTCIANEEIGRTSLFNNITSKDLDYISKAYLIQRFLGIKN